MTIRNKNLIIKCKKKEMINQCPFKNNKNKNNRKKRMHLTY
jgi:hypothetical protein